MSAKQQERAEELIESFELFDDTAGRYEYLIDLGRKLPPMDVTEKNETNLVKGCQSQVWVAGHQKPDGTLEIDADSDAAITKGVVYVLWAVSSGEKPEDILAFDIDAYLEKLQLNQLLSLNRRNGLAGMVQRIKTLAAAQKN
jgi:cysteine desulfuration protein SufE